MCRTIDVIPGQLRERNQKENWNSLEKCKSLGYILAKIIPKTETHHRFLCISRPILGRRSMVTLGEGTEDAPNLSAEGGTENVAWSDRVTNAEILEEKQHEEHCGSGLQSQVEMVRSCGRRAHATLAH